MIPTAFERRDAWANASRKSNSVQGMSMDKARKKKIAWKVVALVCFLICFAIALYQCITILNLFFNYPYTVSVSIDIIPKITLPGITICSSIGVRRTEVEAIEGFDYDLKWLKSQNGGQLPISEQQRLLDYYFHKYVSEIRMDDLVNHGVKFKEFIIENETKCALDEIYLPPDQKTTCKERLHFEYIKTVQGTSMCWTLFHKSKESKLVKIDVPSGFTQSAVLITEEDAGANPVASSKNNNKSSLKRIKRQTEESNDETATSEDTEATSSDTTSDPTTENSETTSGSPTEDTTEDTTGDTTESTTEEQSETTVESTFDGTTGDTTESTTEEQSETTVESTTDGTTEETTTSESQIDEQSTESTTETLANDNSTSSSDRSDSEGEGKVEPEVDTHGIEDETIQPLEIIRFMINFTTHEAISLNEPPSGSISIHGDDQIRIGRLQSVLIKPGKLYDIFIDMTESELLEPPYSSKCFRYTSRVDQYVEERKHRTPDGKYKQHIHPFYDVPLSTSDCMFGCLGKMTALSRCKCWPPEVPYISASRYGNPKSNIKICDWMKLRVPIQFRSNFTTPRDIAMGHFYECFAKYREKCQKSCPNECSRLRVKLTTRINNWPSQQRIDYASGKLKAKLQEYKNCCALISIRMASSEITKYTANPKYEPIEFVSYVGGIVSLWLGFTFIGIVDYVKSTVNFLYQTMIKKSEDSQPTEVQTSTDSSSQSNRRRTTRERLPWTLVTSNWTNDDEVWHNRNRIVRNNAQLPRTESKFAFP